MNPDTVSCPGCRIADYVRSVRDIHSSAAQFTGNGGSTPYVELLARMTELPQPPSPPTPPTLAPPPAPTPTLENLLRSRRHILRFLAVVVIGALSWLPVSLLLAVVLFPRQATSAALSHLAVGDLTGFPVLFVVFAMLSQFRSFAVSRVGACQSP